jgi:hypothetical protein
MTDDTDTIKAAIAEMLAELAATRPLRGPLSVRFGDGVHDVLDADGEVVATWDGGAINRRAQGDRAWPNLEKPRCTC